MRVLVGHSYFLRFDEKLWQAMQPYPPLGTLYAAAMLRERGHEVAVFDAVLSESTAEWDALLASKRPEVAVLFEDNFNYLSKMCLLRMREAAFEMIAAARARGITVVACGADVTDHAREYLDRGADYAIVGEGEETLCELVDALSSAQMDVSAIAGLVYRDRSGEVVDTGHRPNLTQLDDLPLAAYDLIDLQGYRDAWRLHGRFSLNLVSSRGCPFHCNWCAKPIWGQRYNVASPARITREIENLRTLGADHVWFMDDILGIKPSWMTELAGRLEAAHAVTPFKSLSRADLLLRPGEIESLRRAGCETVWIGAESGSQKILDAMEKGTTVDQLHEVARRLRANGIKVAFFLQFGYPGETWDDIEATLDLVRAADPDDIGMSVSYPLPGTPFYERVKAEMAGPHNWQTSDDMAMLYDGPYPTKFYRLLHTRLHAEFRTQKARRGRSLSSTALDLATHGRPRRLAMLARDVAWLQLLKARLNQKRRTTRRNDTSLPTELTREQAGTPDEADVLPVIGSGPRQRS